MIDWTWFFGLIPLLIISHHMVYRLGRKHGFRYARETAKINELLRGAARSHRGSERLLKEVLGVEEDR